MLTYIFSRFISFNKMTSHVTLLVVHVLSKLGTAAGRAADGNNKSHCF